MNTSRGYRRWDWVILLLSITVLAGAPFIGMTSITIEQIVGGVESHEGRIFWEIRVPRTLLAYLVGGGLALSGIIFQAMFRNMLATPFTLGVASGAAFGAALYVTLGSTLPLLALGGSFGAAFLGALVTIGLVYLIARSSAGALTTSLLLSGIVLGLFFSSLILFIQYLSDFTEVFRITRWLMGTLDTIGFDAVLLLLPVTLVVGLVTFLLRDELNIIALGEDFALSRGVDLVRVQLILYFASSAVVAAIVSLCGVISFIGVIVPYCCRALVGNNHARLVPASFLLGGIVVTVCDVVGRTLLAPAEIPVGVITGLVGAPLFLYLLTRPGAAQRMEL